MSHSGVNAVVKVANLHELVVKAFGDPRTITTKYADEIDKTWGTESGDISLRAQKLCEMAPEKRPGPKKIFDFLLPKVSVEPATTPMVLSKPHLGTWEESGDGQIMVRLPAGTNPSIIEAISQIVSRAEKDEYK